MTEENNKPEEFVPEFNVADTNKTVKMKTEFDYSHVNERGFMPGKVIFIPKGKIIDWTTGPVTHETIGPDNKELANHFLEGMKNAGRVFERYGIPTVLKPITDPDVPGCTFDLPDGSTLKFALPEFIRAPGDTNKEMIGKHFIDNDVSLMYPTPLKAFDLNMLEKGTSKQMLGEPKASIPVMRIFPPQVGLTETGFCFPPLKRSTRKLLESICVRHHAYTRSQAREMIKRANAQSTAN